MSDLDRIRKLAELMVKKRDKVDALKDELKTAQEEYRAIEQEDLPELMSEVGLSEIKLDSGETITIKEEVSCSITSAKKNLAIKWLIDHGFGGLVKTEVKVAFERGDRDNAVACATQLGETHEGVQVDEAVHPATLKSFVKEQLAEGTAIPFDLFSIHPYNVAKLSKRK